MLFSTLTNKCKKCNKDFSIANWNKTRKFCSRNCYWTSGILKKPDNLKVRIKCVTCKKLCVRWKDNKNVNKFCSRECFGLNQKVVMTNREVSDFTRKKHAENLLGQTSELSRRWIKDRTKVIGRHNRNLHDSDYKQWRRNICNRDNWKCKIDNNTCSGRLEVHHILDWENYPELRYEINNGITLCHAHHPKGREREAELSPYLQKLVAEVQ